MTTKKNLEVSKERLERKLLAESDLVEFIQLIHPRRLLGNIHRELISWWTRQDAKSHQLLLLPRDHGKSAMVAYRVAWELTRDPALRVLFVSSTSNLAIKQLKFIKDILTSDTYRIYWPEMVNQEETKREKWSEREISVDHPKRKEESIRDPSIFTAGLTTNIVGMHCDIIVLDDVVVATNAYTEEGRNKVRDQYGYLASIESSDSKSWVVGTRYHPNDLYSELLQMSMDQLDENGNQEGSEEIFEVFERQLETVGDGTGEYLWPRQQRYDGKWFGFNQEIRARKYAQYINKTHFRAQYYNDPHDTESATISRSQFQYYEPQYLTNISGRWTFRGHRLNVFAAVDFAYTTGKKSDYTSIVVVGVDNLNNYYILEIDRFKTDLISDYYTHILKLYEKWGFRKLRAEISAAQSVIVKDLKENYIRKNGLALSIEEYRPSRWQGSKEERIEATLQPRYSNQQIWHYKSGNCQALEEELLFTNPPHDDIKDALASVIDFAVAPSSIFQGPQYKPSNFHYHSRFGGTI